MKIHEENELMERAARFFQALEWTHADKDPIALAEMKKRIDHAIKEKRLITYTDLVEGIVFHLPFVKGGVPYQVRTSQWRSSDGAVVGDFLCYLAMQSFIRRGTLATAVVIRSKLGKPGDGFFELAEILGLLERQDKATDNAFWRFEKGYVFNPETSIRRVTPFSLVPKA